MKMKDMLRVAKELGKVEVEAPEGLWGKIKAGLEETMDITLGQKELDKLANGETVHIGQVTVRSSAVKDRFWSKVNKQGPLPPAYTINVHPEIAEIPCWVWTAGIRSTSEGYGQFSVGGQNYTTHRYVWYLTHGRWPEQHILHKCDNRACVNPSHLFEGTFEDNNQDAAAKGRYKVAGEDNNMAKLTAKQVEKIRELSLQGTPNKELADKFGVERGTIWSIVNWKTWNPKLEIGHKRRLYPNARTTSISKRVPR